MYYRGGWNEAYEIYNTIENIKLILTFNKALKIIYGGIIQTNNHNYDARIFIEYCNRVDK